MVPSPVALLFDEVDDPHELMNASLAKRFRVHVELATAEH